MRKKATSHKKRLAISQSTTVTSKQKKKKKKTCFQFHIQEKLSVTQT